MNIGYCNHYGENEKKTILINFGTAKYLNNKNFDYDYSEVRNQSVKISVFSFSQILCEINFEEFKSFQTAIFTIFGASILLNLINFNFQKFTNSFKSMFRTSKCVVIVCFALLESSKLISRKIWVMEKIMKFPHCGNWTTYVSLYFQVNEFQ